MIERAVSLPDVYAAVRVLTEDECELLGVDDEVSYPLFATRDAAEAAVVAMMNDGAAEVTP